MTWRVAFPLNTVRRARQNCAGGCRLTGGTKAALLRLALLRRLFFDERDYLGARRESLLARALVAGKHVDREGIVRHQAQDRGQRAPAEFSCVHRSDEVVFIDLFLDRLAFKSQHRYRHPVSVVTSVNLQCTVTVNSIL